MWKDIKIELLHREINKNNKIQNITFTKWWNRLQAKLIKVGKKESIGKKKLSISSRYYRGRETIVWKYGNSMRFCHRSLNNNLHKMVKFISMETGSRTPLSAEHWYTPAWWRSTRSSINVELSDKCVCPEKISYRNTWNEH